MKHLRTLLILCISAVLFISCGARHDYKQLIGNYDFFLAGIPDSMATESEKALRAALYDLINEKVCVKGDVIVLDFGKKDLVERGIPVEYYKDLRRQFKETEKFFKKIKDDAEGMDDVSLGKLFEDWKAEYAHQGVEVKDIKGLNIFEYGGAVTCPEDNLKKPFCQFSSHCP